MPSLLFNGNDTYTFSVWTYTSGFGLIAKLPANTKLAGMSLDSISDLLPLQFGQNLPYGPVFVGDAFLVSTHRPGAQASTFVFQISAPVAPDGSITLDFGVLSYLVVPNAGNLEVLMPATYQNSISLQPGSPQQCRQISGVSCGSDKRDNVLQPQRKPK